MSSLLESLNDRFRDGVLQLIRRLRNRGVDVPPDAGLTAIRALREIGLSSREDARIALETTLVSRPEDRAVFRQLFRHFWDRFRSFLAPGSDSSGEPIPLQSESEEPEPDTSDGGFDRSRSRDDHSFSRWEKRVFSPGDRGEPPEESDPESNSVYSSTGSQNTTDLSSHLDVTTWDETKRFLRAAGLLPGRRHHPDTRGKKINVRRALRNSFETGGAVVSLPRKRVEKTAYRGCFVVDVSQSILDTMDTDFLLKFLSQVEDRSRRSRIFFFDHEIREVTDLFRDRPGKANLERARSAVTEWGGGTRIGQSLRVLRRDHSGAVGRRTAVFLLSDGLDRGDLDVLEQEIAWLRRTAAYVAWFNPLAVHDDYEARSRAMQISLPYLDHLFGLTGREDLPEITNQLKRSTRRRGSSPLL